VVKGMVVREEVRSSRWRAVGHESRRAEVEKRKGVDEQGSGR